MAASHPNLLIGGHIALTCNIPEDLVFQYFLTNTHAHFHPSRRAALEQKGYVPFHGDGPRVLHSSYVTAPYSQKPGTSDASIEDIRIASEIANWLHIPYQVLHLPRLYYAAPNFDEITRKCIEACQLPCTLLFENVTGHVGRAYFGTDASPLQIIQRTKNAIEALQIPNRRWGFCLDTAHLFVQGQPLTTAADAEAFITQSEGLFVPVVHLNGSQHPFNSGRDKHAAVGAFNDHIWATDMSGVTRLLRHWKEKGTIVILERPKYSLPTHYSAEVSKLIELSS